MSIWVASATMSLTRTGEIFPQRVRDWLVAPDGLVASGRLVTSGSFEEPVYLGPFLRARPVGAHGVPGVALGGAEAFLTENAVEESDRFSEDRPGCRGHVKRR